MHLPPLSTPHLYLLATSRPFIVYLGGKFAFPFDAGSVNLQALHQFDHLHDGWHNLNHPKIV